MVTESNLSYANSTTVWRHCMLAIRSKRLFSGNWQECQTG